MSCVYWIAFWLSKIVYSLLYRVEYINKDNVPSTGGYILAPNHRGLSDVIFIAHGVPKRPILYMAKQELFKNKLLAWFFKKCGAMPIERGTGDMTTINDFIGKIKDGNLVGIFPEGTRGDNIRPARGKSGTALIAKQADCGVIPCAIIYEGKLRPFKKIKICYGEPISSEELFADATATAGLKRATKRIMLEINNLMDKEGVPSAEDNTR